MVKPDSGIGYESKTAYEKACMWGSIEHNIGILKEIAESQDVEKLELQLRVIKNIAMQLKSK